MATENQSNTEGQTPNKANTEHRRHPWLGWALFAVTAVVIFLLGILFASVVERRSEARIRPPQVPIDPLEADSSEWAANWPRQYASYRETEQTTSRTQYGGDYPRDYLEETPANVILFAGYGFAKEYLQARGHTYAIDDVLATERTGPATPATCWTCKSPDVPRLMVERGRNAVDAAEPTFHQLLLAGAADFYDDRFVELEDQVTHPVGCLDCHDPETMRLRVSRPALIEAFERRGRDINEVSHQEMRTLVCAQCHVEYYFRGEGDDLTFPWDEGLKVEDIEAYYDRDDFVDWTHAISEAPMVKMQHPDYEIYSTGVHNYRDVSCSDCHMPYRTEGGAKFTDHHVQSPLLNVENSCAVCHRWGDEEIKDRVVGIQDKVRQGRDRAERAIAMAHFDIAACAESGAGADALDHVRELVRRAQLRWDFVAANNGLGFHSPQECMRVLAAAIDLAQECRVDCARILAQQGYAQPVRYPDFSTKEKAQSLDQAFREGQGPSLLQEDPDSSGT